MQSSDDHISFLVDAVSFAAWKHRNQKRKDAMHTPYINHCLDVVSILKNAGIRDPHILTAAVLHDTVEDTDTTLAEIEAKFGPQVAKMVAECSDDKALPKVQRKQLQIVHAKTISDGAKLVKLADKMSNCGSPWGFLASEPTGWTMAEIRGCIIWCYAVVQQMRGTSAKLDDEFNQLWPELETKYAFVIPRHSLHEALQVYYGVIDKSE
jgi:guanosine-3',5'-bis(diphosphate) 3'-pyrophosphohydrolase